MEKKRSPLTHRQVASLKTLRRSQIFWDSGFRDGSFGVRVFGTGAKSYIFNYRNPSGKQRRITIGDVDKMDLAEARRIARGHSISVSQGLDPKQEEQDRQDADSFRDVVEQFRIHRMRSLRPKTATDYELRLKLYLLPAFGDLKIWNISRREVVKLLDRIAIKAPVQADRVKELIRVIFNFAISRDDGVTSNPAKDIPLYVCRKCGDEEPGRALEGHEIRTLWRKTGLLPQPLRSFFRLLLLTGQRRGEMLAAKWSDIDFSEGIWSFAETKSGNLQLIPLSPLIEAELRDLQKANQETQRNSPNAPDFRYSLYLFPSPRLNKRGKPTLEWVSKACSRLAESVGEHFTPHDLRRTAATLLRSLRVSSDTVEKVLNHRPRSKTTKAIQRYDRYQEIPEMHEALCKLSERVTQLVEEESTVRAA